MAGVGETVGRGGAAVEEREREDLAGEVELYKPLEVSLAAAEIGKPLDNIFAFYDWGSEDLAKLNAKLEERKAEAEKEGNAPMEDAGTVVADGATEVQGAETEGGLYDAHQRGGGERGGDNEKDKQTRKRFWRIGKRALTVLLSASMLAGGAAMVRNLMHRDAGASTAPIESTDSGLDEEETAEAAEENEVMRLTDGYDEKGEWLEGYDENLNYTGDAKGGPNNFVDVELVREAIGEDASFGDMLTYNAEHQSESFAAYMAAMPDSMKPEWLRGKTAAESEEAIENASDEDYAEAFRIFKLAYGDAGYEDMRLEGEDIASLYMYLEDGATEVNHDTMHLGVSHWDNAHRDVMKVTFSDGSYVLISKGCLQPVVIIRGEEPKVIRGLREIGDNPDTGTPSKPSNETPPTPDKPTPPPTPEQPKPPVELEAKNIEAEIANAGPDVDQQELNNEITPPTDSGFDTSSEYNTETNTFESAAPVAEPVVNEATEAANQTYAEDVNVDAGVQQEEVAASEAQEAANAAAAAQEAANAATGADAQTEAQDAARFAEEFGGGGA